MKRFLFALIALSSTGLFGQTANIQEASPSQVAAGVVGMPFVVTPRRLSFGPGGGTVTSVQASGGTTGLTFSGGPITATGTLTMSGTLAAANGGTGINSLGTGIGTFLGTPTSANLRGALTDETGTGFAVFATDPTFTLTDVTTNNASTVQHGWLPKLGGGTTNFLRADGTWALPPGTGTVTVVSSGSLTSTALVTGGGTTTLQTPSATATLDASGNISTPGSISTGVGGSVAGYTAYGQGTATTAPTSSVGFQAPATVTTKYMITLPAAPTTGLVLRTGTTDPQTESIVAAPAGTVVGNTDTQTLTNKRVSARITTITSSATPAVNTDNCDCVTITALAAAITSMTSSLTGTPVDFDQLEFRIKDDGTARAITWGASFISGNATLPTTTTISKALHVWLEWDAVQSKWVCVGTGSDA